MRRKGGDTTLSNRQKKEDHTYDRFLATASSFEVLRKSDAEIKAEKKAKAKKATKKK